MKTQEIDKKFATNLTYGFRDRNRYNDKRSQRIAWNICCDYEACYNNWNSYELSDYFEITNKAYGRL